jgi:PTS system ascorbate-specific IIA component
MIGVILLAQPDLAQGLLGAATHCLQHPQPGLEIVAVNYDETPEQLRARLAEAIARANYGQGVLILTDIYGATHTNTACTLLERRRIELITGMNLPMLIKVLNYRDLPLEDVIDKALSGGSGGIVCAANPAPKREASA